jgi:SagB-type dehydrogenase family enzyme
LTRHGLIAPVARRTRPRHALDSWGQWAPLASAYHFATKDPVIPHGEQHQQLEDSLALVAEPNASDAPVIHSRAVRLPSSRSHDRFTQILLDRRTWRVFGRKAVTLSQLAELLQLSIGVQLWAKTPQGDPVAFKTSPSAGARQPIAAYVAVRRVVGLRAGLYRYSSSSHILDRIAVGLTSRRLEAYVGRQWWFGSASAIVFLAGKVGRVTGRYDHPRAYRFLLLEAGHVCQTFCLTATWMGLAPFCTAALADSRIERDFGMSGIDEIVLYAAGVGTRPEGGYRQWPDHEPGRPYIRPGRASRSRARPIR